ncbi:hypothetical protein M9H77_17558 [Catharanthus roseus]|uniref:Uncharacterized protein n=1 Tax=Catharanthus roseus TaxID=4058 RepID=A0ACC0B4X1_CATRO|nr:hypothetical protein M9H77_17558 [Catharanthus roseus]
MNWDDQEAKELIHGLITRARARRSKHSLGGRKYNRPQEEVLRHEAWHEDNLLEDYGENPKVGQAYFGGSYGGQQEDKALKKIKWEVSSFKGERFDDEGKLSKLLIVYTISKDYSMEQVGGENDQASGRIGIDGKHPTVAVWGKLWVNVVEDPVLLKAKILGKLN